MRILVRMVNDRGEIINDQPETMILPTSVEDRGIETVYRFEVECHELNKKAYCKYYKGQEELEMYEEGAEE